MKVLICGDIHGRTNWQEWIKESYDKIIFLGDYVDHWTYTNVEILDNLKNIIQFKKDNLDKVILLLGNHDLQYLYRYDSHGCSGFRVKAYFDLHDIFNQNKELFQAAYQIDNYLFTHAGLSNLWFTNEYPFSPSLDQIAESLNDSFKHNVKSLFDVGWYRGGTPNEVGGIFWADRRETQSDMIKDLHQVVGHTRINDITTYYLNNDKDSNTSITYCDCEIKPYILEI